MKQFIFAFPRPTIVRGHHKHNRTGEPLRRAVVGAKKFREVRTKLAQAAGFLYRDEDEVRYMAEALGLKEAAGLGKRLRMSCTPPCVRPLSPALSFKRARRREQVRLRFCTGEGPRIAPNHKKMRQ